MRADNPRRFGIGRKAHLIGCGFFAEDQFLGIRYAGLREQQPAREAHDAEAHRRGRLTSYGFFGSGFGELDLSSTMSPKWIVDLPSNFL